MNSLSNLIGIGICDTTQFRSARAIASQAEANALANIQSHAQQTGMATASQLANALSENQRTTWTSGTLIREPRKAGKVCDVCRYDHSAVIGADGFCAQLRADLSWRKVARPSQNRTPEEIQAQLEARYAEMEDEAERLRVQALTACSACRWASGSLCQQPLVIGVKRHRVMHVDYWTPNGKEEAYLCGPEKALWEPIPTRWQRFMEWLAKVIERIEG